MRKLIYLLLLLPFITKGQTWQIQNVGVKTTINSNGSFAVDSVLRIPIRDTAKPSWWNTTKSYDGSLQIGLDGKLYYYYGGVYIAAGSGGSGSGTVTSISQGYGITNTPNPITTTGTIRVDTTNIASKTFLSNRYVPYVGANSNVNLGTYNLMPNGIQYSVSPTSTTLQRLGYWDAGNQTVSINVDSANGVSLQLGQEQYVRASNKTGAAITNGSVVYINGAQGNRPTIRLAQADSGSTSLVIGVATQDIANNAEGFVTTIGVVNGFNTSSFTAGDELYLSPTSEGVLTNVAPSSPYFTVPVAIALNSTNNGSIFVHAQYPLATDTLFTANENRIAPTQKAVKTYVDKRVKYTDTATMLVPYLRKADTASLSNRINAKQDAITLTTTGTSGAATLIGSTLNIPNYATGSGTVTSIATTNGTGITGGTITTSGTLAIDTTLISTRSWRKKGDDSLGAIVATKLNITDTANMRVRLAAGANITLTGTYPNITIAASSGSSLTGYTDGASTGNTALGSGAASGTLTDFNNTNIGYLAGNSLGAGGDQVALGSNALRFNVSGVQNTGVGSSALRSTTGSYNTGVGFRALYTNSTGTNNGAFGYQSLYSNTSGQYNYAFGSLSLYSNTTARYNVGVGDQTLFSNLTGWYNAAIGSQALYNTTGQYNVGIGYNSGNNLTSGSGNLCLGYNTNVASATADNQLNISNLIFGTGLSGSVSSPAGNIGIGTSAPIANGILDVSSTSKSFYPPRMTTTQRDAMTGVQAGAVIYNTTVGAHQSYNGSSWSSLGNSWSLTGNAGTTAGTNFVGTTDNQPLMIKINSAERAGFNQSGGFYVGEGASATLTGIAQGFFASAGDHGVALGRNSYAYGYSYASGFSARAEQFHSIAIGSNARAQHTGSMVASSRKSGADVTSSKDYQSTFAFDEYRFRNGNNDSTLVFMRSSGLMAGANVPTVSLGAGAGTGASSTITGTNNNYTISITTGSSPSAAATIATITLSGITASVNMSPVISPSNADAVTSGIFASGTTTTHLITSTTALNATTTYTWNVICIPKP